MKPLPPDPQMVLMVWHDAHAATTSWELAEDADDDPCVVRSVGWLLNGWKRGHYSIAQSIEGEFRDSVLAVPKKMVQQIIPLEPKK